MDKSKPSRPFALRILMLLLLVIGVGALISGPMLFLSPDGSLMKLPADTLNGTPFPNFIIPGIVLFLFVGVFPVLVAYGLLKRPSWRWAEAINISKQFHWSWTASWAAGVIMLIWIAVETTLLGYISFLQPLIAVWGAAIITLTLQPNTRLYYAITQ
jgi:hypothetical protein